MTGFLAALDRLTKGAILIGWIVLLFFLGVQALQENARGVLVGYLPWTLPELFDSRRQLHGRFAATRNRHQ